MSNVIQFPCRKTSYPFSLSVGVLLVRGMPKRIVVSASNESSKPFRPTRVSTNFPILMAVMIDSVRVAGFELLQDCEVWDAARLNANVVLPIVKRGQTFTIGAIYTGANLFQQTFMFNATLHGERV
jgi:hypothetical protein